MGSYILRDSLPDEWKTRLSGRNNVIGSDNLPSLAAISDDGGVDGISLSQRRVVSGNDANGKVSSKSTSSSFSSPLVHQVSGQLPSWTPLDAERAVYSDNPTDWQKQIIKDYFKQNGEDATDGLGNLLKSTILRWKFQNIQRGGEGPRVMGPNFYEGGMK